MTARVLVVDDIPANVKLLEARLSAEYFDVITATNGEEALATCERAKCDIVLLDVMMPDMNGFEVCRRLKAGVTTHHIPVVMVTALDQPSDRVKGLEAGADDFLTKPVSDVALIARVRSLARGTWASEALSRKRLRKPVGTVAFSWSKIGPQRISTSPPSCFGSIQPRSNPTRTPLYSVLPKGITIC